MGHRASVNRRGGRKGEREDEAEGSFACADVKDLQDTLSMKSKV